MNVSDQDSNEGNVENSASDRLMDSLLRSVAANPEGKADEAFLEKVEAELAHETIDLTEKPHKKRSFGLAWVAGIAAVLAVSVGSWMFFGAGSNDFLVSENDVDQNPAGNYSDSLQVKTSPSATTVDQLAFAQQELARQRTERDLLATQVERENGSPGKSGRASDELAEAELAKEEVDLAVAMVPGHGDFQTGEGAALNGGGAHAPQIDSDGPSPAADFVAPGPIMNEPSIGREPAKSDAVQRFDGETKMPSSKTSFGYAEGKAATQGPSADPAPRQNSLHNGVAEDATRAKFMRGVAEGWESPVPSGATGDAEMAPANSVGNSDNRTGLAVAKPEALTKVGRPVGGAAADFALPHGEHPAMSPLIDNEWKSPLGDPLSTFSIDVDTASWTNIRGMLKRGMSIDDIPQDAVRVEEMINYFDWKYPQPKGDQPFAFAAESAVSPWNEDSQLLRVAIQGKDVKRTERPPANLVFLLDVSGSMNQDKKLPLVRKAISLLVEEMNENDCVSIVVYAGAEGVALHPTKGNEQAEILDALNRLKAGGSTNGGAGIKLAYQFAAKNFIKGGTNRVILCTDGDFNVGLTGTETLTQLVERKAKRDRVFLSVCGFGSDNLNDSMLESITNKGNGTYYFIDSMAEARKVFLKDMMSTLVTIAKDVKIQVEFNPGQVKAYRLIGYANRRLKAEDFEDDRVDAGEVGAGHSVTAFYEIVPVDSKRDPMRDVTSNLRYQKPQEQAPVVPENQREIIDSPELALLKLRYKDPEGDVSKLIEQPVLPNQQDWRKSSEDFRFASAVALFGMKLRGHDSAARVDLSEIIDIAESAIGKDTFGYRAEFVKLLKAAEEAE